MWSSLTNFGDGFLDVASRFFRLEKGSETFFLALLFHFSVFFAIVRFFPPLMEGYVYREPKPHLYVGAVVTDGWNYICVVSCTVSVDRDELPGLWMRSTSTSFWNHFSLVLQTLAVIRPSHANFWRIWEICQHLTDFTNLSNLTISCPMYCNIFFPKFANSC